MDKIDRRSQRSCQLITEALLDLLMEKKFNEITIQEITDTANVGRATFYLHYRNKEECLMQLLTGGFDSLVAEIDQMTSKKDRNFVEILEKVFQYTCNNRKLFLALLSDNPRPNIMGDLQNYIQEKILRAVPIPRNLDPILNKAISVNLTGSLIAIVLWLLREVPTISPHLAARIFVEFSLNGLRSIDSFSLENAATSKSA
ncbi:MAG: TetR/AcrR family transcriptional regulator [Anaerolineaceae bacterium]|jgi:AcrR family transcriptional regulator|nr:MAG: TetR/AcrR family transcriptional regulator [Anaerolineaceae bacterium]